MQGLKFLAHAVCSLVMRFRGISQRNLISLIYVIGILATSFLANSSTVFILTLPTLPAPFPTRSTRTLLYETSDWRFSELDPTTDVPAKLRDLSKLLELSASNLAIPFSMLLFSATMK